MFPTKVRQRPDEPHDAFDSVLVVEALSGEVRSRVARPVVGDRGRRISTDLVGFCNPKPTLTSPGFSSDSNGRTLLFQCPFSSPFFVQHVFCLTESVNSFGRNVSGVLRSQGLLPIEGEAKTLEKCFPTRRNHDVIILVVMRKTQEHHGAFDQPVLVKGPAFGKSVAHDRCFKFDR